MAAFIENKTKSVIVLKAIGKPNLRLFPGFNAVDGKSIADYFKSPAAQALKVEHLSFTKEVNAEEGKEAQRAKEKNDQLNKAQKIITKQNRKLADSDKTIMDQQKIIEQLTARLDKLESASK